MLSMFESVYFEHSFILDIVLKQKMNIETEVLSDLQPNFLNISLLICQLFVGGSFQTAHILYHKESFDDRLLRDSPCLQRIPKITLDISRPGINDLHQNERTDHILQLIFLPGNRLIETIKPIEQLPTFYRIFIFISDQNYEAEPKWIEDITNRRSSNLLLIHNKSSGSIKSYVFSKSTQTSIERVELQINQSMLEKDIFESTLGAKAHDQLIGALYVDAVPCYGLDATAVQTSLERDQIINRMYFKRINMSYIDALTVNCNKTGTFVDHKKFRAISRPIYSELSPGQEIGIVNSK